MRASTDRILTTHVGSLPRNETLADLAHRPGGRREDRYRRARPRDRGRDRQSIIAKQVKAGVDVGNDGEQSRVGFQTYVPRCMCGFGGESKRPPARDQIQFPGYMQQMAARFPHSARVTNAPAAISRGEATSTARRSARTPSA